MSMQIEPQGFIAVVLEHCNCQRCKKIITFGTALTHCPECTVCNKEYAFILTTNITDQQLCQRCYIKLAGMENALQIQNIYKWMHPKEHELWSIPANDLGYVIKDDDGQDHWVAMNKAPKSMQDMAFTYRPSDLENGETAQQRLANAKILAPNWMARVADTTIEKEIDWDNAFTSSTGIRAGMIGLENDIDLSSPPPPTKNINSQLLNKIKGMFK
tara:strand:- start:3104 stop:3748 length:645 start_codon:yes stop_codon:yes gene_type:complete